jgi:hypothetical protein
MARGRNRRGQFTKRSKHRKHRKHAKKRRSGGRRSVAIVRVNASAPRRARRRHHSSSGGGSIIPGVSTSQLYDALGAAAYGRLEAMARSDASFMLNKLPMPVPQLGFSGHMVVYAYLLAKYGPGEVKKYARYLFNGTLDVFAYQLASKESLFSSGTEMFSISGLHPDARFAGGDIEDAQLAGIPFDPVVHEAGAHV